MTLHPGHLRRTISGFLCAIVLRGTVLSPSVEAQGVTFSGRVTDARTGVALEGVSAVSRLGGAVSDAWGAFSVPAAPGDSVTFTRLGYETIKVLAEGGFLTVRLTPSAAQLGEVVVTAFSTHRRQLETAAPVTLLNRRDFDRADGTSIIPVINQVPGVRVDHYTVGDYRVSIRGSALAAPSVHGGGYKVYWNDIPYSGAAGGNSLGQFDVGAIENLEVVRGPGSSLYGAGFGGVLLLTPRRPAQGESSVGIDASVGSDGLRRVSASTLVGMRRGTVFAQVTDLDYDGYRTRAFSRARYATLGAQFDHTSRMTSSIIAGYEYRTMGIAGDLDADQVAADPRQATTIEPAGFGPKAFSVGYNNRVWGERWTNSFSAGLRNNYGGRFVMVFPFFGVYSKEPNRDLTFRNASTVQLRWGETSGRLTFGGEVIRSLNETETWDGEFDDPASQVTERREDRTRSVVVFAQGEWEFPGGWVATAGASYNRFAYVLESLVQPDRLEEAVQDLSPRVALLKRWGDRFSVYASASRGFTPPQGGQFSDFLNSDGTTNPDLKSATGTNLEVGTKFNIGDGRIYGEVVGYRFKIDGAITPVFVPVSAGVSLQRKENAAEVRQQGVETTLGYRVVADGSGAVRNANVRVSYVYNNFTYLAYETVRCSGFPAQCAPADFSGKTIPGTVPHNVLAALDVGMRGGLYSSVSLFRYGSQMLNDANTDRYDPYTLLNLKAGWERRVGSLSLHLYGGVNNVLDTRYSGLLAYNNPFGYFNPAPGINYVAGLGVRRSM